MLRSRVLTKTLIIAVTAGALALSGCMTARESALQGRMPQNHVFAPAALAADMEEGVSLSLVNKATAQSVCLLRVPVGGKVDAVYHRATDLTLVVVAGKAAVAIEDARHFVEPGQTVFIPRMTSYSIVPNETDEDFVALVVFAPRYDPADIAAEE